MEEAEEEGDPRRRSADPINLDPHDGSHTEPPNRQHILAHMRPPTHIQQRTAGSGLSERGCNYLLLTLSVGSFGGQSC